MRSYCYYDEIHRRIVFRAEYTIDEIMKNEEEEEMIALRRGQCFYNERNGEYVYIADMHPGFHDNIIYCYVQEMDEEGEYTRISDSLYTRQEIAHMEFKQQESEEYMQILKEELHEQIRKTE